MRYLFILAASSILFSGKVFAQCPPALQKLDVQIVMEPLKFEYGYTSQHMMTLQENKRHNLLGLFRSYRKYQVLPYAELTKINNQTACVSVTSLTVQINMAPIIYISREAQQFECTQKRVENHEIQHHQFEVNALSRAKPIIENLGRKHFQQSFIAKDKEEVKTILSQKNSALMEDINYYFKYVTDPLHAQIDDETHAAPEADAPTKKKKFGIPSFSRPKKHKYLNTNEGNSEQFSEGPSHVDVDGSGAAKKINLKEGSSKSEMIKGLGVGFAFVVLLIIVDQML